MATQKFSILDFLCYFQRNHILTGLKEVFQHTALPHVLLPKVHYELLLYTDPVISL